MGSKPHFKVTPEIIAMANELASNGLTNEQIADCLDISAPTLYKYIKESEEFGNAINRGKSRGIRVMANNLFQLALNGNAAANIFFLKARAKWRDGDEENDSILTNTKETLNAVKELAARCLDKK